MLQEGGTKEQFCENVNQESKIIDKQQFTSP